MKDDPNSAAKGGPEWTGLSYAEKNIRLYHAQKHTLDLFLSNGAITRAQYEKSLHDLTVKMGIKPEDLDRASKGGNGE